MMLKVLLKKQMQEVFRSYYYNAKTNTARSKAGTIGFMLFFILLLAGVIGGTFFMLAGEVCGPLVDAGVGWLFFTLMGMMAIFLGTFGGAFSTFNSLYLAKDNDQLLAMPIPVSVILASRILNVLLLGMMYTAAVYIPSLLVYWIKTRAGAGVIISGLIMFLLISLIVLVLSCLLGWVVAKISLKLKNKGLATAVISLAGLGLYYFLYFKAQMLLQKLVTNATVFAGKIEGAAKGLYYFGHAAEGDWLSLLIVAAVVAVLLILTWMLLKRTFIGISTATGATATKKYKEKPLKVKSQSRALVGREINRFMGSPIYLLNCGLGILLLPVIGILMLIKGKEVLGALASMMGGGAPMVLLLCGLALVVGMDMITAPSVSLEGKTLWLIRSLPVRSWDVLKSKLSMALLMNGIPMLFACVLCAVVLQASLAARILFVVLGMVLTIFFALWGLFIGLKKANFNWTNETAPIKQSAAAFFGMFGSWIYGIAIGGLYFWKGRTFAIELYLGLVLAVTAVLSLILFLWIRYKGPKVFEKL